MGEFFDEFFHHLKAKLRMGQLASAKAQSDLDLHLLAQELHGMMQFHPEIMRVDGGTELDFFDLGGVLMFPGFFIALGLLVTVLAKIDQSANRRRGSGGNLNQIDAVSTRGIDGILQRKDAQLFAIDANDPDFAGTDFPVDPYE